MKGQNYFAKGNQGNMEIEDGLKKIKSRQLGRCVKQLQLANAKLKQVGTNFILIINQVKSMNDVLWYLEGMEMKENAN